MRKHYGGDSILGSGQEKYTQLKHGGEGQRGLAAAGGGEQKLNKGLYMRGETKKEYKLRLARFCKQKWQTREGGVRAETAKTTFFELFVLLCYGMYGYAIFHVTKNFQKKHLGHRMAFKVITKKSKSTFKSGIQRVLPDHHSHLRLQ
jgi:hypothetical protein